MEGCQWQEKPTQISLAIAELLTTCIEAEIHKSETYNFTSVDVGKCKLPYLKKLVGDL